MINIIKKEIDVEQSLRKRTRKKYIDIVEELYSNKIIKQGTFKDFQDTYAFRNNNNNEKKI